MARRKVHVDSVMTLGAVTLLFFFFFLFEIFFNPLHQVTLFLGILWLVSHVFFSFFFRSRSRLHQLLIESFCGILLAPTLTYKRVRVGAADCYGLRRALPLLAHGVHVASS